MGSLSIAARTYIYNNTQQNTKSKLCGNQDETVHFIMSESSKLAQK